MEPILLIGEAKLACSVAVCLVRSGHDVFFVNSEPEKATAEVTDHLRMSEEQIEEQSEIGAVRFSTDTTGAGIFDLVIVVTDDCVDSKKKAIGQAQQHLSEKGTLAANMLSIELDELQSFVDFPSRLIGLNWVEPAHTTFFLEIVGNQHSDQAILTNLQTLGKKWNKDPYILESGFSVKARLGAALTREALHLVSNGYATHEDIDRNCRNDAGYYLPFVGNARYMDLMGTYAYGVVMKDLNQHLSKSDQLDPETIALLDQQNHGMDTGKGFFEYPEPEAAEWKDKMATFSYQIRQLIKKYPFGES